VSTDITGQVTIDQHPELSYESPSVHLFPASFAISRPNNDTSPYGGIFDFTIFNVNVLERWLYDVRRQPVFHLSCKGDRLGSMDCLRGYAAASGDDTGHSTFLICSMDMVLNLSRTSVHFQIDGEFGHSLPYSKPLYKELSTFSIAFTIEDEEMLDVCRDHGQRLLDYRNRFVFGGENAEPSG
jgi:hypothetical protein